MFEDIGSAVEKLENGSPGNDDDEPQVVDNIESLCINCHEQGITRLLLTKIPFFREIILMSFECPKCHYKNSEVQSAGTIQEKGCKYALRVGNKEDLNRQVVKSETCTSQFEELGLEIPAQRGQLTTVEGLLSTVLEDISGGQSERERTQPQAWAKIEQFIEKGKKMLEGRGYPFTLQIDDPAGNSWIEPKLGDPRGKWSRIDYPRTQTQNTALALTDTSGREQSQPKDGEIQLDEVYTFPASCPSCTRPCVTHMKMVDIPHFQEVIIMSTVCGDCGYKSNDVKTGGAVPEKGRMIKLRVEDEEDLARDVLKSQTCALSCPELNLDLTPGTLGGRFTTLEGLLSQIYDELFERIYTQSSDSLDAATKERWVDFFQGLREAREGKKKFTCILDDPLAASYVQNLCAPDPDPQLTVEDVARTEEQNDTLGISDMKTEGYDAA